MEEEKKREEKKKTTHKIKMQGRQRHDSWGTENGHTMYKRLKTEEQEEEETGRDSARERLDRD